MRIRGTVMGDRSPGRSAPEANAGESGRAGPELAMSVRTGGHAELVPDWLVNLAELGWRVIAVAALVVILWLVASVLWVVTASIAVAIVISACFAPMVLRLRAGGRSRTAAAGIVWLVAILVGVVVLLLLALAFLPAAVELFSRVDAGLTALQAKLAELQIPPFVGTLVRDAISAARTITGDEGGGLVASAASLVTVLILATFLVFFFLRDGDKAWVWIFQTVGDQKRERITAAGDDALARVGGYLRGTTVLSGLVAVTDLVFMLILGVPLAAPLAVLAFLAGFIPYFGGIVTTAIILLVTWAALGPTAVVVLLVLIGIRNLVLGYAVRPAVYGRTVKLHPALVLIVLPAGYELAGILGLFAAVPVTAVVLAVAAASVALVDPDPHPPLPGLVPAWLDRIAQWSWRIILGCVLIALAAAAFVTFPLVLTPLVLAVILAATLEPLVGWLMGRGRSRARAAAIAVGGGFLAVTGVLVLTMVSLVDQAGTLADETNSGASSVSAALGGLLGLGTDAVAGGARADGPGHRLRGREHRHRRRHRAPQHPLHVLSPEGRRAALGPPHRPSATDRGRRGERSRLPRSRGARRVHVRDRRGLVRRGGKPVRDHGGARASPLRCRSSCCRSCCASSRTSGGSSRPGSRSCSRSRSALPPTSRSWPSGRSPSTS